MREETLKKKKEVIDEIKSNIEKAKSVVLVDYIGLNVLIEIGRASCRERV